MVHVELRYQEFLLCWPIRGQLLRRSLEKLTPLRSAVLPCSLPAGACMSWTVPLETLAQNRMCQRQSKMLLAVRSTSLDPLLLGSFALVPLEHAFLSFITALHVFEASSGLWPRQIEPAFNGCC